MVAELGAPIESRKQGEGTTDVVAFQQGYSLPTKFSRVVFHGVADVFTFGLWEVAGTPVELSLQGEEVRAEVQYDRDDFVRRVEYFSGAHLVRGGPTLADWMRNGETVQTAVVEASPTRDLTTPEVIQAGGVAPAGEAESPQE